MGSGWTFLRMLEVDDEDSNDILRYVLHIYYILSQYRTKYTPKTSWQRLYNEEYSYPSSINIVSETATVLIYALLVLLCSTLLGFISSLIVL